MNLNLNQKHVLAGVIVLILLIVFYLLNYWTSTGQARLPIFISPIDAGGGNGDIIPPTVSITLPLFDPFTTTQQITFGGIASDDVGVTSILWSNDRGGNGVIVGAGSFQIDNIILQPGTNHITITARDAAGNEGTDTITVIYNP